MRNLTSFAAALIAATLTAASGIGYAAQARAEPAGPVVVAVHYGDLDLASADGREALDARIRHAVRTACEASVVDLRSRNRAAACRADLTAALAEQRLAALNGRQGSTALAARR